MIKNLNLDSMKEIIDEQRRNGNVNITINGDIKICCCCNDDGNNGNGNGDGKLDDSPANPKNPLDFAGAFHNYLLKEARLFLAENTCEADDLDCLILRMSSFLQNNHFNIETCFLAETLKAIIADIDSFYVNFIHKTSLFSEGKYALINAINDLRVLAEQEVSNFAEYKRIILKYENKFIREGINADANRDVATLLSAFSVLRYSLYLNLNMFGASSSIISTRRMKGWVKAIIVVAADAVGVVGGGIGATGVFLGATCSAIAGKVVEKM